MSQERNLSDPYIATECVYQRYAHRMHLINPASSHTLVSGQTCHHGRGAESAKDDWTMDQLGAILSCSSLNFAVFRIFSDPRIATECVFVFKSKRKCLRRDGKTHLFVILDLGDTSVGRPSTGRVTWLASTHCHCASI